MDLAAVSDKQGAYRAALDRANGIRADAVGRSDSLTAKRKRTAAEWLLGLANRSAVDAVEAEARKVREQREQALLDREIADLGAAGIEELMQPLNTQAIALSQRRHAVVIRELRERAEVAGHRLHAAIENMGKAYADVAAIGAVLQRTDSTQPHGPIVLRNFDVPVPSGLEAFRGGLGRQHVVFHSRDRHTGREIVIDAAAIEVEVVQQFRQQRLLG